MNKDIDPFLFEYLKEQGYLLLRNIDGSIIGLHKFLFTFGICTRLDLNGYYARFCYEDGEQAFRALVYWDGKGYPQGPWKKQKGPIERAHPLLYGHKGGLHWVRNTTPELETWKEDKRLCLESENWL